MRLDAYLRDAGVAGACVVLRVPRADMQGLRRRRETALRDLTGRDESANPRRAAIFGILARNMAGFLIHGVHGAFAETRLERAAVPVAIAVRCDSRSDVDPPLPRARFRVIPPIVEVPGVPLRCVATRGGARPPIRRLVVESAMGTRRIVVRVPMLHRHTAAGAPLTVTIAPWCNVHRAPGAVPPSAAGSGKVP